VATRVKTAGGWANTAAGEEQICRAGGGLILPGRSGLLRETMLRPLAQTILRPEVGKCIARRWRFVFEKKVVFVLVFILMCPFR
jgi:hypothetical protein